MNLRTARLPLVNTLNYWDVFYNYNLGLHCSLQTVYCSQTDLTVCMVSTSFYLSWVYLTVGEWVLFSTSTLYLFMCGFLFVLVSRLSLYLLSLVRVRQTTLEPFYNEYCQTYTVYSEEYLALSLPLSLLPYIYSCFISPSDVLFVCLPLPHSLYLSCPHYP